MNNSSPHGRPDVNRVFGSYLVDKAQKSRRERHLMVMGRLDADVTSVYTTDTVLLSFFRGGDVRPQSLLKASIQLASKLLTVLTYRGEPLTYITTIVANRQARTRLLAPLHLIS